MAVRRPLGARRAPVNPPLGRKSRPQGGVLRATQETAPAGRKSRPQGGVLRATQETAPAGRKSRPQGGVLRANAGNRARRAQIPPAGRGFACDAGFAARRPARATCKQQLLRLVVIHTLYIQKPTQWFNLRCDEASFVFYTYPHGKTWNRGR
jgi:hypothetical protein